MIRLLIRLLHAFHRWPRLVLALSVTMGMASIPLVFALDWQLSILDLFAKDHPSRTTSESVQSKFGGLGTLTVVVHSPDSLRNARLIADLVKDLNGHHLVNFTEFRTEADFYRKHKLLYIRLADLQEIHSRVMQLVEQQKSRLNPLLVQVYESSQDSSETPSILGLEDLEHKYLSTLRDHLGNADGSIQVLEIYPVYGLDDLESSRQLVRHTQKLLQMHSLSSQVEIRLGGAVYESVANRRTMLAEVRKTAWITAGIALLFLTAWFYRHPQIPLLAAFPVGIAMLASLAFAQMQYGRINLFTLILGLTLPGIGADFATHLLSRYAEERRKGLSPALALESTILGTGPAVSLSALSSAIAFYCLAFLPLQGIRELGVVGGTGILLQWLAVMVVLPALLLLLQRKKFFRFYGPRHTALKEFWARPFPLWKRLAPWLAGGTLLISSQGVLPKVDYDFGALEYEAPTRRAKELLQQAGLPSQEPAIFLTSGPEESEQLFQKLRSLMRQDSSPTIQWIATFSSLLPSDQKEKAALLQDIREELGPYLEEGLQGPDSATIRKIMLNWDVEELTVEDLPLGYKRKFQGQDGRVGEFSFVFPAIDIDQGNECRAFARDVANVTLDNGKVLHSTGLAILRADLLDLTLPKLDFTILSAVGLIFLIVLIHLNRLHWALLLLVSPSMGLLWLLALMRLFSIPLTPYSALVFPLLIGLSLDGSVHLWLRYKEESTGSVHFIMRRTGSTVLIATLASLGGWSGLLFSSHPGLRSMGLVTVLGMSSLLLAHLTVFPMVAGWLDWRRYQLRNSR